MKMNLYGLMFVMEMDSEKNTVTLGEKGMEFSKGFIGKEVNFISGEMPVSSGISGWYIY